MCVLFGLPTYLNILNTSAYAYVTELIHHQLVEQDDKFLICYFFYTSKPGGYDRKHIERQWIMRVISNAVSGSKRSEQE